MKVLIDENVPRPLLDALRILLKTRHDLSHVHDLKWQGTKDVPLYEKAAGEGFEAVLTNDRHQMQRPLEVEAIAQSGLHRIEYRVNAKHGGLIGLATAIATVCAGLPHALDELRDADGQRLILLNGMDPTRRSRIKVTDPTREPPKFWPSAPGE